MEEKEQKIITRAGKLLRKKSDPFVITEYQDKERLILYVKDEGGQIREIHVHNDGWQKYVVIATKAGDWVQFGYEEKKDAKK